MFDINTAINAAIETAVQERFVEMAQQHANIVGAMAERITKLDTRIAELEAKADPHAVLSREDVAEVVRELWEGDYESEVQDKVDRAVEDIDLFDAVRSAARDLSFSVSVD